MQQREGGGHSKYPKRKGMEGVGVATLQLGFVCRPIEK